MTVVFIILIQVVVIVITYMAAQGAKIHHTYPVFKKLDSDIAINSKELKSEALILGTHPDDWRMDSDNKQYIDLFNDKNTYFLDSQAMSREKIASNDYDKDTEKYVRTFREDFNHISPQTTNLFQKKFDMIVFDWSTFKFCEINSLLTLSTFLQKDGRIYIPESLLSGIWLKTNEYIDGNDTNKLLNKYIVKQDFNSKKLSMPDFDDESNLKQLYIEQCEEQVATVIERYFDITVIQNDEERENLPEVVRTIFEHHPKIKSRRVYILQKKIRGKRKRQN